MYAWQATVQDEAGNVVPLPVVTVYLNNGATLARIYNEAGAQLPNPLTGTVEGFVQFWAEAGQYKIRGASGGNSTELWGITIGFNPERIFSSRGDMYVSPLENGSVSYVGAEPYRKDQSATGINSALWDIGLNGFTSISRPENSYISAFHDLNTPRVIRFYSSADGLSWRLLNEMAARVDAGTNINGGNPVVCWRDGWFYVLTEFALIGSYDFRIYKTRDFTTFKAFDCKAGPTPLGSNTTPAPGASVPASAIWGADMAFTPSGELHVFVTVPFGPDVVDDYGFTVGDRRTYKVRCNNLEALTFDAPSLVLPGGDNWSMIDASVTRTPENWLFSIKDEVKKTIRVYNGPSINGPWAYQEEVVLAGYKIEGSSVVPRRTSSGVVWDMYVEAHDTASNIRSTRMMVYRGNSNHSGWQNPEWIRSTAGIRHGTPLNLGFEDPAAFTAFSKYAASNSGTGSFTVGTFVEIQSGNVSIVPQQGCVYFVTGNNSANLTILEGPADRFWISCLSESQSAGVTVLSGVGMSDAEVSVGYGYSSDRLVEFIRRPSGKYIAGAGSGRSGFTADKGGTAQTVSSGQAEVLTFGNITSNIGGHFNGTSWAPSPGKYMISANVMYFGGTAAGLDSVQIRRNGNMIKQFQTTTNLGTNSISVSAIIQSNGSDYFDFAVFLGGSGTKTIAGAATNTWIEAVSI